MSDIEEDDEDELSAGFEQFDTPTVAAPTQPHIMKQILQQLGQFPGTQDWAKTLMNPSMPFERAKNMFTAPFNNANEVLNQPGNPRPDQIPDIGGKEMSWGTALMPGLPFAEGGSIGASGGRGVSKDYWNAAKVKQMDDVLNAQIAREKIEQGVAGPISDSDIWALGNRKLSNDQVKNLLTIYDQGAPVSALSEHYGLSNKRIYDLINKGGYSSKSVDDVRLQLENNKGGSSQSSPMWHPEVNSTIQSMINEKPSVSSQEIADKLSQITGGNVTPGMVNTHITNQKAIGALNAPSRLNLSAQEKSLVRRPEVESAIISMHQQGAPMRDIKSHLEQNVINSPISENTIWTWMRRLREDGKIPYRRDPSKQNDAIKQQLGAPKPFDPNET